MGFACERINWLFLRACGAGKFGWAGSLGQFGWAALLEAYFGRASGGCWAVLRANAWAAELGGTGLPLGSSAGLAVSGLTWCSVSVSVAAGGNETGDGDAICVMSWLSSGCLSCGQPPLGDSDWP